MWAWGCYGRTWRHASIDEALRLLAAGATTGVVLVLGLHVGHRARPAHRRWSSGRSSPPSSSAWCGSSSGCSRSVARSYTSTGVRVAVVGAGTNGAAALREMQQSPVLGLVPVVAVDDDPALRNRSMHGVPHRRVGRRPSAHRRRPRRAPHPPRHAVGARGGSCSASPTPPRRRSIPVRVLRESSSWVHGMPRLREMSDLNIEDLLGREQVDLDLEPVRKLLHGRRVLVTGGGGWIGSEIARQVAEFGPVATGAPRPRRDPPARHRLRPAGHRRARGRARRHPRRLRRSTRCSGACRPEIVFHAAAHKHVPMLEDYACEAIRTNVFGTLNVIDACARVDVSQLVCISTDKAATPDERHGRVEVGGRADRARARRRTTATARCASATCSGAAAA